MNIECLCDNFGVKMKFLFVHYNLYYYRNDRKSCKEAKFLILIWFIRKHCRMEEQFDERRDVQIDITVV